MMSVRVLCESRRRFEGAEGGEQSGLIEVHAADCHPEAASAVNTVAYFRRPSVLIVPRYASRLVPAKYFRSRFRRLTIARRPRREE